MDIVIVIAILAAVLLGIFALAAAMDRLHREFVALSSLAQWAILNRPSAAPADAPYPGLGAAMPGDVKFHFPPSMFPERPEP